MHGRWQFGLRRLMLSITLLAVLLGAWVSLGPRARFYYRCQQDEVPRELWARLWDRYREGWMLAEWEPVMGNGPKGYLLVFWRPSEILQPEVRWSSADGWGMWIGDELPRIAGNWWSGPRWIDLTADGVPELVMDYHGGGNSVLSSQVKTFRQEGPRLLPVHLPINQSQAVKEIKDLDGDGLAELIVAGAELAIFGDRAHYEGLPYRRIYHWHRDANALHDVSPQFAYYLRRQLADQLKWSQQTYDEGPPDALKRRARDLAAMAVYRWCIGETEQAWDEYDSALSKLLEEAGHKRLPTLRASFIKEREQLAGLLFEDAR